MQETALEALIIYAQRVQEYNDLIDMPDLDYSSAAYVAAANAMEAANEALLLAAAPLLESAPRSK
jgi:hypothetical protein